MVALFIVGLMLAAALRPLIVPVARGLGLMRENFAGETIPTAGGWVIVVAVQAGYVFVDLASSRLDFGLERGAGGALAAAALLYGALGGLDDRYGDRSVRGLRGHFRRFFRERRVTTGFVKAAGGAIAGVGLAGWVAERQMPAEAPAWLAARVLLGGTVIALSANAINLLDLRPLRAIKGLVLYLVVILLLAALFAPARAAALAWLALPLGALAAYAPLEARRQAMLGDTGANALGALAGTAAVYALPAGAQLALAAALAALHLYAERRSLTAALAAHPLLDRLDRWGWRE